MVQEWCCRLFEAVLVVKGSHEYYCHGSVVTKQAVDQALQAMCSAHSNLHLMHADQGPLDINGKEPNESAWPIWHAARL